jgi:hypothetical protein
MSAPSIASGGLKDATPGSDAWSLVSQSQSVVIVGDYNFGPFCDRALLPIFAFYNESDTAFCGQNWTEFVGVP